MAKILIADDDPDFLSVSRSILKTEGYEVLEATNGSQALEIMRHDKPDLILLDVMMSSILEGLDVSKEMESDPDLKDIPIIMVSSIATTEHAAVFPDSEPIPIEAWVSKPIQPQVLLRTIKRFLE